MKEKFHDYLETIGTTKTARARVQEILTFYERILPEEISDIFVTDFLNEDGVREFENLWMFSDSLVMEAKRFLTTDDFDMLMLPESIPYWQLTKQAYDFVQATDESRFTVTLQISKSSGLMSMGGELKASRENCDFLRDLFLARIAPRSRDRDASRVEE